MSIFARSRLPKETRDSINALAAEFEDLRVADSARLDRLRTYRQETESSRESSLSDVVASSDYGRVKSSSPETFRHRINLPFGMALQIKHAYRIAGRLPDAVVDRREESELERYRSDTIEKMWWGIVRASEGDSVFADAAWDASGLGSCCIEPYFDVGLQMPLIRAIDPAGVLVVRGIDNPHDFQRIYRFWQAPLATVKAEYKDAEFGGVEVGVQDMESTHKVGQIPMVTIVEMKDRQESIRFVPQAQGNDSIPLLKDVHKYGFAPLVVIPNIGPYRDVWGWSDYDLVRALVHYIPVLFSREADIIRAVAGGAMIEKGTGQDAEAVRQVVSKGGVLPSKRDGSVEPIATPEVPNFEQGHADRALEMFKMLGFAPDAAWGGSDTRSGSDRNLQLQPLLEFTAMKQLNWSSGLARLAAMCFQMTDRKMLSTGKATYRGARPGVTGKGQKAFSPFVIGPSEDPLKTEIETEAGDIEIELPRNPKELFNGDYSIRFVWQNRINPDDPAYILAELNKFQQGVQSLRTTLERLGFQAPEDEIKLIEDEAQKHPWLREGMIRLITAQLSQDGGSQGGQEGAPVDQAGSLASALGSMGSKDGAALDSDALAGTLQGTPGSLFGGA